MSVIVSGENKVPDEFDDVTAEIAYPPLSKDTTEKEFLKKAGNGYLFWVVGAGVIGMAGFGFFLWGIYEMSKWL